MGQCQDVGQGTAAERAAGTGERFVHDALDLDDDLLEEIDALLSAMAGTHVLVTRSRCRAA